MLFGIAKTHLYRPLRQRVDVFEDSEPETTTSVPWGLEKFDGVAGRVLEQDLLAAPAAYGLVAEARPSITHALDFAGEVPDLQLDAVPASGLGPASVGHGLPRSPGSRRVQQEAQIAPREAREAGGGVHLDAEAEVPSVEGDRRIYVIDNVTHAYRSHRYSSFKRFIEALVLMGLV